MGGIFVYLLILSAQNDTVFLMSYFGLIYKNEGVFTGQNPFLIKKNRYRIII